LALFQASNFDVVVTDYRMPRMNGVEMIARIRQSNPNARIVLLSGFVEPLG
jgi:two-component system response regulator YesN